MSFAEWYTHARAGYRGVIFSNSANSAKTGELHRIEVRFWPATRLGEKPRFQTVTAFRQASQRECEMEANWDFDDKGKLWRYMQDPSHSPRSPTGLYRWVALSALRNLYETWRATQDAYSVEYPDDSDPYE